MLRRSKQRGQEPVRIMPPDQRSYLIVHPGNGGGEER